MEIEETRFSASMVGRALLSLQTPGDTRCLCPIPTVSPYLLPPSPFPLTMAPRREVYRYVQDAVTKEIYSPGFQGSLPPLSEAAWAKILEVSEATRLENDRLEFVGDGLIAAVVSMECHRTLPQGSPGLYTVRYAYLHWYPGDL